MAGECCDHLAEVTLSSVVVIFIEELFKHCDIQRQEIVPTTRLQTTTTVVITYVTGCTGYDCLVHN